MNAKVNLTRRALDWAERSRSLSLSIATAALLVLAYLDYVTGYELGFALFYLFPVMLATWAGGRSAGIVMAGFSAALWLLSDFAAGHPYQGSASPIWNASMRLLIFLLFAHLIVLLKNAMQFERALSLTDALTGVANRRALTEALHREQARSTRFRRPFGLAFIDIDDFKKLNDQRGHSEGDRALQLIARTLSNKLRTVDVVARIGGDEFAVIFPECDRDTVRVAVARCFEECTRVIRREAWNISLSVGVATFHDTTLTVEQMLAQVDDIMYRGKRAGKNTIYYDDPASADPAVNVPAS